MLGLLACISVLKICAAAGCTFATLYNNFHCEPNGWQTSQAVPSYWSAHTTRLLQNWDCEQEH